MEQGKIFCPNCGMNFQVSFNYCPKCGFHIEDIKDKLYDPLKSDAQDNSITKDLNSSTQAEVITPSINSQKLDNQEVEEPISCMDQVQPDNKLPQDNLGSHTATIKDNLNNEEYYIAFIGKNAPFYIAKIKKFYCNGTDKFAPTWNWPASMYGFIWMLYRKLYLWALIAFLFNVCIPIITIIALAIWDFPKLFSPTLHLIGYSLGITYAVVWGITGNYIYYKHLKKEINEIKGKIHSDNISQTLTLRGGVNSLWRVYLYSFVYNFGYSVVCFGIFVLLGNLINPAISRVPDNRLLTYNTDGRPLYTQQALEWLDKTDQKYLTPTKEEQQRLGAAKYVIDTVGFATGCGSFAATEAIPFVCPELVIVYSKLLLKTAKSTSIFLKTAGEKDSASPQETSSWTVTPPAQEVEPDWIQKARQRNDPYIPPPEFTPEEKQHYIQERAWAKSGSTPGFRQVESQNNAPVVPPFETKPWMAKPAYMESAPTTAASAEEKPQQSSGITQDVKNEVERATASTPPIPELKQQYPSTSDIYLNNGAILRNAVIISKDREETIIELTGKECSINTKQILKIVKSVSQ